MFKRRRFKQITTLEYRLAAWVQGFRDQAEKLPPGPNRDALLKKAKQAETASHLDDWVSSRVCGRRRKSPMLTWIVPRVKLMKRTVAAQ